MTAVPDVLPARIARERRRHVLVPLARAEARRLLLHPLVGLGLALSALLTWSVASLDSSGAYLLLMGVGAMPLALGTMLAANAAALRSRRDDADELYVTLPVPASVRTVALLAAVAVAALAAAALLVVQATVLGAWDGLTITLSGQLHTPGAADLVQAPLLVLACGALGVALARLVPTIALAPLLAVITMALTVPLVAWSSQAPLRWLFLPVSSYTTDEPDIGWPCNPDQPGWCATHAVFDSSTMGWHAGYLVAFAVLAGAVALLRDRPVRVRLAATATVVAVTVVLGAIQVL
jgi:hypothetical protein